MSATIGRFAFAIGHDHPSLAGHFPGAPIVPGVVLLERVLAAVEAAHGTTAPLRLPQVKFLRPLLPGEHAEVELAEVEIGDAASAEGSARRWRFRVLRGDVVLATGEVVAG
jgi:3-hydroxymyristoyl/3-hydroxydecanoyl-(acyl carrier protein) dehydratase